MFNEIHDYQDKHNVRSKYFSDDYNHHHRHSSRKRKILYLWIALSLETALLFFLALRLSMLEKENLDLEKLEKSHLQELETVRPELEKLRSDVDALVNARLPNLIYIKYDNIIPIDNGYIKNVVFSISGTKDNRQLEFKIVLENLLSYSVYPRFDVVFFDKTGIQIGLLKIGGTKSNGDKEILEGGETRSFSNALSIENGVIPDYFMIRVVSR
jgi:hypothetical protein